MARPKEGKVKQQAFDLKDLTGFDWDNFPWKQIQWKGIDWDDPLIGDYTALCPDENRSDFEYGAYLIVKAARHELLLGEAAKAPSKVRRELDRLIEVMDKLSLEARAELDSASRSERFHRCFVGLIQGLGKVPDLFSLDRTVRDAAMSEYPSLEALGKARRKQAEEAFGRFSPEAKAQLDEASQFWPEAFNGPVDHMCRLASRAVDGIEDGKRKPDPVREKLGSDAWAIWAAHGGNVDAEGFADFVDRLIDAAGLNGDGGGKARINTDTLVRDIRNRAKNGKPPSWQLWSD
jgi:hypothetical protein